MPQHCFVPVSNGHEIHTTVWGDECRPAIIMWHVLARTGRDFDELADALSADYFVICPDTIGRGLSSWSDDPEREYSMVFYLARQCQVRVGLAKLSARPQARTSRS